MATSPYHISSLLDKMGSVDKDFRFMATNDLMTELQKDSIKLDDDSEKKVVQSVLKLVEDKNGEVQNLAVKCLGPLVKKIKDSQIEVIINSLCSNMFSTSERLRDISSVGLKTVIAELPRTTQTVASVASRNITGKMVDAINKPDLNQYVLLETLDILGDLIHRYGTNLVPFHEPLLHVLLPLLVDPKALSVRKRAYMALCYLCSCCQQQLFESVMRHLLTALKKEQESPSSMTNTRTFIQALGAISRQAGQRIGSHLDAVVPLIMHFVSLEEDQGDDELKESCLQAFEALALRCYREITPYIKEIVGVCLRMLSHDPNYNYDSGEDGAADDDDMDTEDMDDNDEEDDEYSDDDDVSWKVRRASAKCLTVILGSRVEMLMDFYHMVSPTLISRFKEREENVKADIFTAYRALLNMTQAHTQSQQAGDSDAMEVADSPVALLATQVDAIIRALHKQLRDRSVKTRQGCFALLTALITVLPGALDNHVGAIIPGILYCLGDQLSTSNMKIDTLNFMTVLLNSHSPNVLQPHLGAIIPAVITAVDDSFYRITSEALLVLNCIVKTTRPTSDSISDDFKPFVLKIYQTALRRLKAADIDQEVKERAITCMGQVVASLGDSLQEQLTECMPIFVDRLRNEITRLTTVRAITLIVRSPLKIDITFILDDTIPLLASFLRKNHRDLRLSTLHCLDAIFQCYSGHELLSPSLSGSTPSSTQYSVTAALYKAVLNELSVLINDSDLHISQLVLTLLCTVMDVNPDCVGDMKEQILPSTLNLVLSSLLQGSAMSACLLFFTKLVQLALPGLDFHSILKMLTGFVYESGAVQLGVHKQAYRSISKCVAAICDSVPGETFTTVEKFVNDIKNDKCSDSIRLLCLLSVGEIGKKNDLSRMEGLEHIILGTFSSQSEEVRSAASYTLGSVSAGNLQRYLPFVLAEIQANPKRQYLLLHSLKEVITCHYGSQESVALLEPHVTGIWDVLFQHFESPEEGTRNVVAECVGKLALVHPQTLLPKLQENLGVGSAFIRSTVVTALKYTISDQPQPIDSLLHTCIGDFLATIGDADLNVRRVALVAFNSAAHNKPSLVRDLLDTLLPNLYRETKVRKELIREVEMGPFKHTVDDGLDLRKAAFECMYTLLETCLDRLDIFEFLNHVEDGLKDHYDIKMLTFLLIIRLSHLRPTALLQRIDKLIDPLRTTIQSKAKANSVKQEFEKQDELKRSAMRAISSLLSITDGDKCPALDDFVAQIKGSAETSQLFESVQADAMLSISTSGGMGMESMDLS